MKRKKKVRKNQLLDDLTYYGRDILLLEESKAHQVGSIFPKTTVVICDGHYLGVSIMPEKDYTSYGIDWHDPGMVYKNYGSYFPKSVRVVSCFMRYEEEFEEVGLEEAAEELAKYISEKMTGNILLIGHSKGGLVMYKAAQILQPDENRQLSVMTVSAPFGGTIMATKNGFRRSKKKFGFFLNLVHSHSFFEHKGDRNADEGSWFLGNLGQLPEDVNHIAFISTIHVKGCCSSWTDRFLKLQDSFCNLKGDGIVSMKSQESWPIERDPDMCLTVGASHENSLEIVLKDFARYSAGEYFFSDLEEFSNSELIEELICRRDF